MLTYTPPAKMILILSAGGGNQKGGNSFLDLSPGDGRTHRSARMRASQRTAAPDGAGRSPPPTGGGAGRWRGAPRGQRGVVTPPYGSNAGSAQRTGRRVVGPYGWSTEVLATGRCRHRPLRMVAESCRNHPGSTLSAEREAGQIWSLPDDLRVQHGVQRSEASAKPRPCSRRGCVN